MRWVSTPGKMDGSLKPLIISRMCSRKALRVFPKTTRRRLSCYRCWGTATSDYRNTSSRSRNIVLLFTFWSWTCPRTDRNAQTSTWFWVPSAKNSANSRRRSITSTKPISLKRQRTPRAVLICWRRWATSLWMRSIVVITIKQSRSIARHSRSIGRSTAVPISRWRVTFLT